MRRKLLPFSPGSSLIPPSQVGDDWVDSELGQRKLSVWTGLLTVSGRSLLTAARWSCFASLEQAHVVQVMWGWPFRERPRNLGASPWDVSQAGSDYHCNCLAPQTQAFLQAHSRGRHEGACGQFPFAFKPKPRLPQTQNTRNPPSGSQNSDTGLNSYLVTWICSPLI